MFGRKNPTLQPGIYDLETNQQGRGSGGSVHQGQIPLPQGQMTLPPGNLPFPQGQNAIPQPYLPISQAPRGGGVDLDAVRDVVQELYGPGLRQIGRPEFHKPYPDAINRDNLYLRGYCIPEFSLFSREDGQSTLEHIARFTIQCGELANYENFTNYRLRLFPNTLTGAAFAWYATLLRNSIFTW